MRVGIFALLCLVCAVSLSSAEMDPLRRAASLGAAFRAPSFSVPGAEVRSVEPGSAVAGAGLMAGDRVLKINGILLNNPAIYQDVLLSLRGGETVSLEVERGGKLRTVNFIPAFLPPERIEGVEVLYDSVLTNRGHRLRSIVTRPAGAGAKRLPAILLVSWLSCSSVETPVGPLDGSGHLLHGLARKSGFVLMRVDKSGVGDSEGPPCSQLDFETELDGLRSALRDLKKYAFVDPDRIFLLGLSNGGGFAPLVAEKEKVRGYIVSGGWCKTWLEHMLEIERRALVLSGKKPGEVNAAMAGYAELYTQYLIHKKTPLEVIRANPKLKGLWQDWPEHQYGRPAAFYQQLQDLNIAAAWEGVDVPVLSVYGGYDWIMSRDDHEKIAEIVNTNHPGLARFVEIPRMDHGWTIQENMQGSFNNFGGGAWDESVLTLMIDWLKKAGA